MLAYQHDFEEQIASGRELPARTKPPRSGYSPRHARRRSKPATMTSGIQGRCNKRRS